MLLRIKTTVIFAQENIRFCLVTTDLEVNWWTSTCPQDYVPESNLTDTHCRCRPFWFDYSEASHASDLMVLCTHLPSYLEMYMYLYFHEV